MAGRLRLNPPLQFPKAMMQDYYFYNDDDPREDMLRAFIRAIGTIFAFVLILFFIAMLTSCKTRTVVVETVRTDTTYITKQQRDSIWLHDSIFMHEYQSGDTVFMLRDRWHTKYIESIKHDTTYIAKTDSVPVPYPVEVKVPRELSWWQKTLQRTGGIALILLLVWIGRIALKIYTKRFF